jgi:DNA-binding response OmpR family regulator
LDRRKDGHALKTSILVAEGDPALAGAAVEVLSSGDYSVRAVSSFETALAEVVKEVPDVILVSDELSGGKGAELCRRLQEKRENCGNPLIVFLVNDPRLQEDRGSPLRLDGLLRRPVDPVSLESTIENLLQRRRKNARLNPLTRLPGPPALSEEVARRSAAGEQFSTCTFRLSAPCAKSYAAKYGQLKFAAMIRLAARTVASCALAHGGSEAFVAQRGSMEEPEFVVLIAAEKKGSLQKSVCEEFDADAELLYDKVDRAEGRLVMADEAGNRTSTPFVYLETEAGIVEEVEGART